MFHGKPIIAWSIETAKSSGLFSDIYVSTDDEAIAEISRKYDVTVVFFDGRGGPPARGGGKTHQFYASLGSTIEDKEVQLTIQGQTMSSNFGTLKSNLMKLFNIYIFS